MHDAFSLPPFVMKKINSKSEIMQRLQLRTKQITQNLRKKFIV